MNAQDKKLLAGPAAFILAFFLLQTLFDTSESLALSTAVWMAVWWIFRPVHIAVTSLLPIVVNAVFTLVPNTELIAKYFTDIVILLLGSNLICMSWSTTGLDKRISLRAICLIGTSLHQQILVWFGAAVLLSAFMPNTAVAAILCPIAAGMLKCAGETDIAKSKAAIPILLAIGWGSGIGGVATPIGSPANLVAIAYFEQYTGHEFMYISWMKSFLPLLFCIFWVNLFFLWSLPTSAKSLPGVKEEFQRQYAALGKMKLGEKKGLFLFVLAVLLAFLRPLYAGLLPGMKPAYVFLLMGLLMFMLHDEKGEVLLDWHYAEKHAMWGIMIMASSGLALGQMIIGTGAVARLAELFSQLPFTGSFMALVVFCGFACFMTEMSSNTGAASICLPMVLSICAALNLDASLYLVASTMACSCAYILPVTTRAIPVGYGLDAKIQMREGLKLSLLTVCCNIVFCYGVSQIFPELFQL